MKERISVVGLGKLGLCLAACFAEKGFETIGVDINEDTVNSVNNGMSPFAEHGLPELVSKLGGNMLKATLSHREAIEQTDITFVLVSTPSEPDGSFSNRYAETALKSLAEGFSQSDKKNHLFVISSTIIPCSTEKTFIPLIEKYSGRKLNVDFQVCYNPDFVALGSVIHDFFNPDLVVIGQSSPSAGKQVESIYRRLCDNNPQILKMSIINAEITKVCLNTYITMKISFANAVSQICQSCAGADVDVVTDALGCDRRISPLYLRGGLSYGGTCFPRDTAAFIALSKQCGCEAELIKAVQKTNEQHNRYLSELVLSHVDPGVGGTVSILGLAFKPGTPVIVESPAIKLIDNLLQQGIDVAVYDPLAMENTKNVFGDKISYAVSVEDCISKSSVCVITTQEDEFKRIDETYIVNGLTVIIDCWRILDPAVLGPNVNYVPMGRWTETGAQSKSELFNVRDYSDMTLRKLPSGVEKSGISEGGHLADEMQEWIERLASFQNRLYYRDQTPQSLNALVELVHRCKPTKIVELGTLSGLSLRAWLSAKSDAEIIAIDLSFVALHQSQQYLPANLSRVNLLEQDILKTDFAQLWSDEDKVILYVDAHDTPNNPIMSYILKNALPALPKGSVIAVDDLWYCNEAISDDAVSKFFNEVATNEVDSLGYFDGYYALIGEAAFL